MAHGNRTPTGELSFPAYPQIRRRGLRRLKQHAYSAYNTRNETYSDEDEQKSGWSFLINDKSDQRLLHCFGSANDTSRYDVGNWQESH